MSKCFAILTALGEAMVADSIRRGTDINLKEMAVGDADYTPSEGQVALMHERARVPIESILFDQDNPAWLRISALLPADLGGWYIHEAGLFAENGNLFAVAKLDGSYKPVYNDGLVKEIALDIVLEVSSDANVALSIDPSTIAATRKWVIEYFGAKMASLQDLFNSHIKNYNNPHRVTPGQLGVYTKEETQGQIQALNVFVYLGAFHDFYLMSPPAGWKVRNGAVLTKADIDYPELWAALGKTENAWMLKTEAGWKSMSSTAGGIGGVPFFVLDTAAKSIRLPDTRGDYARDAGGGTMVNVGQWHGDAIRNITGTTAIADDVIPAISNAGAFSAGQLLRSGVSLSSNGATYAHNFSASRVVPTAAENRTRAFGVLGCVYTGGEK